MRRNGMILIAAAMLGGCMVEHGRSSSDFEQRPTPDSGTTQTVDSGATAVTPDVVTADVSAPDTAVTQPDAGTPSADSGASVTPDAGTPDTGNYFVVEAGAPDSGVTVADVGFDSGATVDVGYDSGVDAGTDTGVDTGFDAGRDSGTDVVTIVPAVDPTARLRVATAAMGLPVEIREVWPRTRTLCSHETYQAGLHATTSNVFTRCDFSPEFDELGGRMRIQVFQRGVAVSGVSADMCRLLLPIWQFGIFNAATGRELYWYPESRLIERPGESPLYLCDITIPRALSPHPYGWDYSDFEFEAQDELRRLDAGAPDTGTVVDAGVDVGFDTGTDAGVPDSGVVDTGTDTGTDAGTDGGMDAGLATYWYRYVVSFAYWGATSGHMFVDDSNEFRPLPCMNADAVTVLANGDVRVLCQLPRMVTFLGRFTRGTAVHTAYATTPMTCAQAPGVEVAVFRERPVAGTVPLSGLEHILVGIPSLGMQCRHRVP